MKNIFHVCFFFLCIMPVAVFAEEEFTDFDDDTCKHGEMSIRVVLDAVINDDYKPALAYHARVRDCYVGKATVTQDEGVAVRHFKEAAVASRSIAKIREHHFGGEGAEEYYEQACAYDPIWCIAEDVQRLILIFGLIEKVEEMLSRYR